MSNRKKTARKAPEAAAEDAAMRETATTWPPDYDPIAGLAEAARALPDSPERNWLLQFADCPTYGPKTSAAPTPAAPASPRRSGGRAP